MRSWHFTADYFWGTEQREPYPGASGFEYQTVAVYKPCGVVVQADSEQQAWAKFWDVYSGWSADYKPIRNERLIATH